MPITIERLPVSDHPRSKFEIYVQGEDWKSDVGEYIQTLQQAEFNKLMALLGRFAGAGPIRNREQFAQLRGYPGIYEFKPFGVRVFCHYDGKRVVLTEGSDKRSTRAGRKLEQSYKRAQRRKDAYFAAKAEGTLEVRDER